MNPSSSLKDLKFGKISRTNKKDKTTGFYEENNILESDEENSL